MQATRSTRLWPLAAIFLAALFLAAVPTAGATEIRSGETITIAAGETVNDDLYVTGGTIIVDGIVDGDLIGAAGDIVINGEVTGDLLAGAQSIRINGRVNDDVRAAGALLQLGPQAQVGDEIMATSYALVLEPGSQVGGDVTFFGGQANIDGAVGGDLNVNAGGLALNGSVAGNIDAALGSPTAQAGADPRLFMPDATDLPALMPGLQVGDAAKAGGDVNIAVPDEASATGLPADFQDGITVGPALEEAEPANPILDFLSEFGGRFLVFLVAAAAVSWLLPRLLGESAAALGSQPWHSLGWGGALFFIIPLLLIGIAIAAGLLALLLGLVGLGGVGSTLFFYTILVLAAAFLLFAVVLALLTKVVAGYAIGRLLFRGRPDSGFWLPLVVGLAIVALLAALPWVGWLFSWLITAAGLGALWQAWRARHTAIPTEKSPQF